MPQTIQVLLAPYLSEIKKYTENILEALYYMDPMQGEMIQRMLM